MNQNYRKTAILKEKKLAEEIYYSHGAVMALSERYIIPVHIVVL